jgi:hypothetical protein
MATLTEVISCFPPDLQEPVLQLWNVINDELGVKREDFTELKNIVQEIAKAQTERAEAREVAKVFGIMVCDSVSTIDPTITSV